ncbi:MAG: sugar phosphate isomerase/epimerase family protein [Maribacter sp.]
MSKIGFNVLAWSAGVSDDLLPIMDRLKEIGYNGVEFFIGSPEVSAYRKLGKHAQDIGLAVTAVTVVGAEGNPIDPSPSVRAKAFEKIKWAIDRSHDLNAEFLCGPFHSAFGTFAEHAPQEREYDWSAEILNRAGAYAQGTNLFLGVEALNRFECYLCNTMDQLKYLLEKVHHPHVKGMFDTHHANIEEKNSGEAIATIAPYLGHVHISENDRGTPGTGNVSWDESFSALAKIGYDGWYTIEGFTRNDIDFANSINVWREFAQPWDMAEKGFKFIQEMIKKHEI